MRRLGPEIVLVYRAAHEAAEDSVRTRLLKEALNTPTRIMVDWMKEVCHSSIAFPTVTAKGVTFSAGSAQIQTMTALAFLITAVFWLMPPEVREPAVEYVIAWLPQPDPPQCPPEPATES